MMTAYLKWKSAQGVEEVFELTSQEVVVGRKSDADLIFPISTVSRHHAKFVRGHDGYSVFDLSNTQGTYVNGERITQKVLEPGDRICLGRDRVELRYFTGKDSAVLKSAVQGDLGKSLHDLTSSLPTASSKQSSFDKISSILDFQFQCEKVFSGEKPFEHILAAALKISGAERGYVLLKQAEKFEYIIGMNERGDRLLPSDFRASRSVVRQVSKDGKSIYMADGIDQQFAEQRSILALNLKSLACLPLRWLSPESEVTEVRGVLYLDSTKQMHALSKLDEKILYKLALEASNVFEKLEIIKTFETRKRLELDLALAQNELRAAEELRRAEIQVLLSETAATMGRFAAALSHELNTPLGALKATLQNYTALAEIKAALPPARAKNIEATEVELHKTAMHSVERLQEVVQRMQRLTNLDRSEVVSVDLNSLLKDVVAMATPEINDAVTIELQLQALPAIRVRPQEMSAVFLNLIHNAIEAQGGSGRLSLFTERSGDRVEVLLQDNGRGMSAEELAQVFDPAFKIRGGRVSTGNWTLFSSRQIVREHGGEIEIHSLPGKGTTVRVFLPCSRDDIS